MFWNQKDQGYFHQSIGSSHTKKVIDGLLKASHVNLLFCHINIYVILQNSTRQYAKCLAENETVWKTGNKEKHNKNRNC